MQREGEGERKAERRKERSREEGEREGKAKRRKEKRREGEGKAGRKEIRKLTYSGGFDLTLPFFFPSPALCSSGSQTTPPPALGTETLHRD